VTLPKTAGEGKFPNNTLKNTGASAGGSIPPRPANYELRKIAAQGGSLSAGSIILIEPFIFFCYKLLKITKMFRFGKKDSS
jgi:hypothetical protein